jgi:S1-C subfamily serine protease
MARWFEARWTLLVVLLSALAGPTGTSVVLLAAQPARYSARFANGERFEGDDLTDWQRPNSEPKLNGRRLLDPANPLRWMVNRSLPLPKHPRQFVETFSGDRIPGTVTRYLRGDASFHEQLPPHFVVQPPKLRLSGEANTDAPYRVATKWIRRIVWHHRREYEYQPRSVFLRDGSQLKFRVARYSQSTVTLLLDGGTRTLRFAEIAEIHWPEHDAWQLYLDELALLVQVETPPPPGPAGLARLMQVETTQGLVATTSLARLRPRTNYDPKRVDRWLHGIQPVWSLDIIWIRHGDIRVRRFFAPNEVPLSRLFPSTSSQISALGGSPWPARVNANARGGPLRCRDGDYGWGFGVHATSELRFGLSPLVSAFRTGVGLDQLAGKGGCIRARIIHAPTNQPNHQTAFLTGSSQTTEVGWLPIKVPNDNTPHELVLQVDLAHVGRPTGTDPLDIRDIANWVDPLLQLDPQRLADEIEKRITTQVAAWRDWRAVGATPATCRRGPRFLEWADTYGRFEQTFSAVEQPLVLSQHRRLTTTDRWLVINATRSQNGENLPRLQVRIQGEVLVEAEFPLWDKSHLVRQPIVVSLADIPASENLVEIELWQLPGSPEVPIQWHSIYISPQHPALYQLFEDDVTFVSGGAGDPSAEDAGPHPATYLEAEQRHSGSHSLRVESGAPLTLRPPHAVPIRQHPQPGQYRFILFAFRKDGGKLAAEIRSTNPSSVHRYEAGPEAPQRGEIKHVWKQTLPTEWVSILRDLFGDFGEFDLQQLTLSAADGQPALFDHIYLARTQDDFQLATHAPPPEETNRQARRELAKPIREKALPAVVMLEFPDGREATGTIISATGEIVTAGHCVVGPQQDVTVRLADNRRVKAKTLGVCRDLDLGLVKISDPPPFPFVDVHATDQFPAKPIYLGVAHPARGAEESQPAAHLLGIRRALGGEVWTDFDLQDVTTGGPLLGADGRLMAVHSRKSQFGGFYYSQFRDWPAVLARLQKSEVWGDWRPGTGPMLGVEITNTAAGCRIIAVFDDSPAARGGLRRNDVITQVAGQNVIRLDHIYAILATTNPGQAITIAFRRGSNNGQAKLTLMPRVP